MLSTCAATLALFENGDIYSDVDVAHIHPDVELDPPLFHSFCATARGVLGIVGLLAALLLLLPTG
jgi:hypothetical protein